MKFYFALLIPTLSTAILIPGGVDIPEECIVSTESGKNEIPTDLAKKCKEFAATKTGDVEFGKQQIYAMDTHLENTGLWKNFTADWICPGKLRVSSFLLVNIASHHARKRLLNSALLSKASVKYRTMAPFFIAVACFDTNCNHF